MRRSDSALVITAPLVGALRCSEQNRLFSGAGGLFPGHTTLQLTPPASIRVAGARLINYKAVRLLQRAQPPTESVLVALADMVLAGIVPSISLGQLGKLLLEVG